MQHAPPTTDRPLARGYKGAVSELLDSVTMSLDRFIAGPGGDMRWLTEHLEEPKPKLSW